MRGRGVREGWRNLRRGTMAALEGEGAAPASGGGGGCATAEPLRRSRCRRFWNQICTWRGSIASCSASCFLSANDGEGVGGEDGLEDPLLLVGGRPPRLAVGREQRRGRRRHRRRRRAAGHVDGPRPETQRRRNSRNSLFAGLGQISRAIARRSVCEAFRPADTERREPRRRVEPGSGRGRGARRTGGARGGRGRCGGREEGGGGALVASQFHAHCSY